MTLKGFTKINSQKTHCPKGHELKGDNLKKYELSIGKRACKMCSNERQKLRMRTAEGKKYQLEWQKNNPEKLSQYNKIWNLKNRKEYSKLWDRKNPERRKQITKNHEKKPERKEYHREWDKEKYHKNPEYRNKKLNQNRLWRLENPRSGAGLSYEEQESMMETRIRFKNTCKWLGCGKTSKETSIHVHHILPKEEYPELAAVSQFQITYCREHHALWHKARGDKYWKWILSRGY